MDALISFMRVVHILNAILMAWPFYALVMVNQRGVLGPPMSISAFSPRLMLYLPRPALLSRLIWLLALVLYASAVNASRPYACS